jgi:hypothetical protein
MNLYDPKTHSPVSYEALRQISGLLKAVPWDNRDVTAVTDWLEPLLARRSKADRIRESRGEREEPLPGDFFFAIRVDPAGEEGGYELYLCDKADWAELGTFPWTMELNVGAMLPGETGYCDSSDGGLFWMYGDFNKARIALRAAGFEEKPEILTKLRGRT